MTDVKVPDIGDFDDVPIIEILVAVGDTVSAEDPLVTLESDKATMDVPAPVDGVVKQLAVQVGDRVSQGSVLMTFESEAEVGRRKRRPKRRRTSGSTTTPSPSRPTVLGIAGRQRRSGDRRDGNRSRGHRRARSPPGGPRLRRRARLPGRRARLRPRRLQRRLPRRGPRAQDRADRALRPSRRGLPERRLHPLQGAAARRPRDRRDRGDGLARDHVRHSRRSTSAS